MEFEFELIGNNLIYFAIFFSVLLTTLMLMACYICLLIRRSDERKKYYLIDLARRRGIRLDVESLRPTVLHTLTEEVISELPCPIVVPELGIFVS